MTRWLGTLAVLACALPAQELRLTLPRGAAPGQEVEVRCYGRGLSDLTSVLWFRDGIEVVEIEVERDSRARIVLRVADDCPLGAHLFLLHTRRGITRAKTFHIGPLPSVAAVDGNLAPEKAQPIALDVTVDGRILRDETDWFAFDADAGTDVHLEVEGIRLADFDFDPQLEVYGPDGSMLVRGDDSALGRLDPIVTVHCETAGVHRIALRDVAFRGSSYAAYRLHVGTFPRPTGLVPAGGRPGEQVAVTFLGEAEPRVAQVTMPLRPGLHELFPIVGGRAAPTPLIVAVDDRPWFVEGAAVHDAPPAPCAFHGVIDADGQEDRFAFRATKGERIDIRVLARTLRSPLDPVLIVRDDSGASLASNDDAIGLDGRLRFTAPADGTFSACVSDHLGRGGSDRFYRLEVGALPAGATTREAVRGRREEDFGIAVPQGGRTATMIQVSGLDARDGVSIGWSGLPPGVAATGGRMVPGAVSIPVVFEAAADAEVVAVLATPTALADVAPHRRSIRHEHAFPLLRIGRIPPAYLMRGARALPVAVTEPCPFTIELDAPRVPLVQRGSADLPFRLTRAAGFEGTVTVRMLSTPGGLSAGTAKLPRDEVDGAIPLSARSNSSLGTWPIVLIASASVEGVNRKVASSIVDLEIQEPWITAKLPRVQVEQGATGSMPIVLERRLEFPGTVAAEFVRLPKGVEARIPPIAADTTRLDVELAASADAEVGRHRGVYVRLVVTTPDGEVVQAFGGGEIRVDRPLGSETRPGVDPAGGAR